MVANLVEKKLGRTSFLYVLITVILISSLSLLQLLNILDTGQYYYLASFLALGLGILHLLLWPRYFTQINREDFLKGLLFTMAILVLAVLAAALAYYFLKMNYSFLSYALPFILPFLAWQVYHYFLQIPVPLYKGWHYPLQQEMPDLDMVDLSQIQVVQFVFAKKPNDATQTNFTSKAPLNMTLGQLFFIFINDYNERNAQNTIEFLDNQKKPNAWLFYRKKKWFGRKFYFDPDLSFKENNIIPNEFIYVLRVS